MGELARGDRPPLPQLGLEAGQVVEEFALRVEGGVGVDGGGHGGLVKSSNRDARWSRCGAWEGRANTQSDPLRPLEPLGALQEEQGGRLLDPGQPRLPRPAAEEQVDSSGGEQWRDPEEHEQLHRDLLAR